MMVSMLMIMIITHKFTHDFKGTIFTNPLFTQVPCHTNGGFFYDVPLGAAFAILHAFASCILILWQSLQIAAYTPGFGQGAQ